MKKNHQIPSKIIHTIEVDDETCTTTQNINNPQEEEEVVVMGSTTCREGQSITLVAQSVTSLAQAVKNLQTQLQSIDERIQNHEQQLQSLQQQQELHKIISEEEEPTGDKSAKHNVNYIEKRIENDQKKKKDFIKAYKSVISIVKALKVLPELKQILNSQNQQQHGINQNTNIHNNNNKDIVGSNNDNIDNTMIPQIIIENNDDNRNATTMLRNIALTLSDVDTIASYVSNNSISNHQNNDNINYDDDNLTITDATNSIQQPKLHQQEENHGVNNNKMDMVLIEKMLKQHSNNSFRLQVGLTLLCCILIILLNFILVQNNHHFHGYEGTGMSIHDDLRDSRTISNNMERKSETEVGIMSDNDDETSVQKGQEADQVQPTQGFFDEVNEESGDGRDVEEEESLSQMIGLSVEQDSGNVDRKDVLFEHMQDTEAELVKTDNEIEKTMDPNVYYNEDAKLKFSWMNIVAKAYLCESYEDSSIVSMTNLCF
jgi:hypothetical protein